MARQPLLPKYNGLTGYNIGPGALAANSSAMAKIIADCVAIWPYVEHDMALALSGLLDSSNPAAVGVFTALRGFRSQRDVIEGAAAAVFDQDGKDLVAASLSVLWTAQKARDDIAHGLWGDVKENPDVLVWISGADYANWNAKAIGEGGAHGHRDLLSKLFVYTRQDLDDVRTQLLEAREVSFRLAMYCIWRSGTRAPTLDQSRERLLELLPVRRALDRIIERRGESPA